MKPYSALPNNVKEFFNTGHTFQNSVAIGGGNETSNYYTSFSDLKQKGVMPGTGYQRSTAKLSGATKLSNKFSTNGSITYTKTKGDLSVQGQGTSPYDQVVQTPRDISLLELKDIKDKFNDINGYYSPYTLNPYWILANNTYRNDVERVNGRIQLGYNPIEGLDITYRLGGDVYSDKREQKKAKRVHDVGNENVIADASSLGGFYEVSNRNSTDITSDLIASYSRNINEDFGFRLIAGHNVYQQRTTTNQTSITGLVVENFYNFDNQATPVLAENKLFLKRLWGVYGDLTLSYKDYLFLNGTARRDVSSTLPVANNAFFYPSGSVSFLFSELLKNEKISLGKLRLSAAKVGNDAPLYALTTTYDKGSVSDGFNNTDLNFPLNGVPGFSQGDLIGSKTLTPEFTTSFEAGLDMNFFNNRLGFEASVYRNLSTDQILQVPIAPSSGFTAIFLNSGSISNKGVEVLLRGTPIDFAGFRWDVSANFTKNINKVENLFGDVKRIDLGSLAGASLVAQKGLPYGSFLVTTTVKDSATGNVVVNNKTGLPEIDPVQQIVGNIQPKWMGGLTNSFSYKGITLSLTFDTKQGMSIYSRTKDTQEFVGTSPNTLLNDREPVVLPNTMTRDADGNIIRNTTVKTNVQDYFTDQSDNGANMIDGSFVKLREVALYYSLPKSILDKTPLGNVTLGLSGRNLWLSTPGSNTFIDPEVSSFGNGNNQGFEFGSIPSIRSFGGNIRITF